MDEYKDDEQADGRERSKGVISSSLARARRTDVPERAGEPNTPESAPQNPPCRHEKDRTALFHRYIYQYLIKRGYLRSAAQYAIDLAPTISKDLTVPADSPTGFLFEWWMVSCSILEPLAHPERWNIRGSTPSQGRVAQVNEQQEGHRHTAQSSFDGHASNGQNMTGDPLSTPEEWARLVQTLPFSEAGMQNGLASLDQQISDGQALPTTSALPSHRWPPSQLEHDPMRTDAIFLSWDRAEALPNERFVDQYTPRHVMASPSQSATTLDRPGAILPDLRLDWNTSAVPPVGSPFPHQDPATTQPTVSTPIESTSKQNPSKSTPSKAKKPRKGKAARKDTGASDVSEAPRGKNKKGGQKTAKHSGSLHKDECETGGELAKVDGALLAPTMSPSPMRGMPYRGMVPPEDVAATVDTMRGMEWLPAINRTAEPHEHPSSSRWSTSGLDMRESTQDGIDMEETLAECVRNFIDATSPQAPAMSATQSSMSHGSTALTHPSTLLDSPLRFVNTSNAPIPGEMLMNPGANLHLSRPIIPGPRDFTGDFRGGEMPILDLDSGGIDLHRDLSYHSRTGRHLTMEEYKSALNLEIGRHQEQDALMHSRGAAPLVPGTHQLAPAVQWQHDQQVSDEDDGRATPRPYLSSQAENAPDELQAGQEVQEAVIAQFMEKFRGRIE